MSAVSSDGTVSHAPSEALEDAAAASGQLYGIFGSQNQPSLTPPAVKKLLFFSETLGFPIFRPPNFTLGSFLMVSFLTTLGGGFAGTSGFIKIVIPFEHNRRMLSF